MKMASFQNFKMILECYIVSKVNSYLFMKIRKTLKKQLIFDYVTYFVLHLIKMNLIINDEVKGPVIHLFR